MNGKMIVAGVAGVVGLALLFASANTVQKGNAAAAALMGKIDYTTVYPEGLHFINPLKTLYPLSIADQSFKFSGIDIIDGKPKSNGRVVIQTADKLTTGVDVEIVLQVQRDKVPYLVGQQVDSTSTLITKYVQPALMEALVRNGSAIAEAQTLFTQEAKDQIKMGILTHIQGYLSDPSKVSPTVVGAVVVKDVKIQGIALPERIQAMIEKTKERQEDEQVALSKERIRQTDSDAKLYERKNDSEAKKAEAEAEAFRRTQNAIAQREEADAAKYAMEKQAEGIAVVNRQLTPQYIQYVHAEAAKIASEKYLGGTPETLTVMGEQSQAVVPFMKVGK